mgnify:CR=1 FL=1|jgi:hypothetical protein
MTKPKKMIKKYLESDYKKNRTLLIRKKFISVKNDKYLKGFQAWLGTRYGIIFRILIVFWTLQIIWVRFIL